ncbi:MAG: hypothetical protein WKH64_19220 [Chloroflexia bacterium]
MTGPLVAIVGGSGAPTLDPDDRDPADAAKGADTVQGKRLRETRGVAALKAYGGGARANDRAGVGGG